MRTTTRTQKANTYHACEVCECSINIDEHYHKLVFFTRDEIVVAKICADCFSFTEDLAPISNYDFPEDVMHDLQAVHRHVQSMDLAEAQADAHLERSIFEAREAHALNNNGKEW